MQTPPEVARRSCALDCCLEFPSSKYCGNHRRCNDLLRRAVKKEFNGDWGKIVVEFIFFHEELAEMVLVGISDLDHKTPENNGNILYFLREKYGLFVNRHGRIPWWDSIMFERALGLSEVQGRYQIVNDSDDPMMMISLISDVTGMRCSLCAGAIDGTKSIVCYDSLVCAFVDLRLVL